MELLDNDPVALIAATGLLGLIVGSFLNVVIYRLPIMLERGWRREAIDYLELSTEPAQPFDLIRPPSCCPLCAAPVRPWQNIPIISYLILGGRCANCRKPISMRYPAVEALTAILSGLVVWRFGFTMQAGMALILTWALISLSLIDIDRQLLPDSITLPLLWLGLAISIQNVFTDSHAAIIGAISGYLSLWTVYKIFKALTGKEGMGFGDFKLLALLGAWMGWQYLAVIILLSSFVGALIGTMMIGFGTVDRARPIPFGPYLSGAGWLVLLCGEDLLQWYFALIG